jgi:hypothetical protein
MDPRNKKGGVAWLLLNKGILAGKQNKENNLAGRQLAQRKWLEEYQHINNHNIFHKSMY